MGVGRLWHAHGVLEVERELLELSSARCHWRPFEVSSGATIARVTRVSSFAPGEAVPLRGSPAPWGYVQVVGDRVRAHIPDEVYAAEAVLRIAYQLMTVHHHGLMAHASSVAFGESAVAALGPSGAGKSTLAALCALPGNGGLILTDEVVQLYPDGRCAGTPFRSNQENVGAPGVFSLASLLVLRQAKEERLEPLTAHAVMNELLQQVFRAEAVALPPSEVLRRLVATAEVAGVHRLSFRRHAAVGRFLKEWIDDRCR